MSRHPFFTIAFIASLFTTIAVSAAVSLPDGTTSTVLGKVEKSTRPPASGIGEQGERFFAESPRADGQRVELADAVAWFADDMAITTVEERQAFLQKWKGKFPLAVDSEKSMVIRRFASDVSDGKLAASTVFADSFGGLLDAPEGGMLSHDGVLYFACVPEVMMLKDADGDGRAEQRAIIQDGFGVRVSLPGHGFGGLTLGPDGRIYGTIGDKGGSFTTKSGVVCKLPNQGAAFRFELDGSGFEYFHTGLRNPGRIAFDALGNAFTVDENPGAEGSSRIVYLVDGGDSGWEMEHEAFISFPERIGVPKASPNRWIDEKLFSTQVIGQPAFLVPAVGILDVSPGGMVYYPGTGFLENGVGRFFVADLCKDAGDSGVWSFEMKPAGAGMEMVGARKEITGIAASDVEFSPDGHLQVVDFATGQLIDVNAGAKTWLPDEAASAAKLLKGGFHQRSSAELVNLLRHPDSRVSLRAQMALTRKADAFERFAEATLSSNFMTRIHGIRGLGIIVRCGSIPEAFNDFGVLPLGKSVNRALEELVKLTEDQDEEIRCQSVRALADAREDALNLNLALLLDEASPRVPFFAAILAGKRKMVSFFGPVCDMLAKNAGKDPWLQHAGAYALQRMNLDATMLRSLVDHESPAVRLAAVTGLRNMESPDVADFLEDADPIVVNEAIRAICDLDLAEARPAVAALLDKKRAGGFTPIMLRRMMCNSFRIGGAENAARVLKLALDSTLSTPLRNEAFKLLGHWSNPPSFDPFSGHWHPLEPRDTAEIAPLLRVAFPTIQPQDVLGITSSQGLAKTYQIDPTSIPVATPPPVVSTESFVQQATGNPWLYIVIGLLVVTGFLLYLDPRIF